MSVKADTTGLEYHSAEWFEACAAIKRGQLAGGAIQFLLRDAAGARFTVGRDWQDISDPTWDGKFDYRLAKKPREVWVRFDRDGAPINDIYARKPGNDGRYIKFREVIE